MVGLGLTSATVAPFCFARVERALWNRLAKPDDAGAQVTATITAQRHSRRRVTDPQRTVRETPVFENIAMKLNDVAAAGALVHVVHVLRNQGEARDQVCKSCDRMVARVRLGLGNEVPTPAVPAPDEHRIGKKCVRRRKVVGVVLGP
jgi:hypothetical protein